MTLHFGVKYLNDTELHHLGVQAMHINFVF